MTLDTLRHAVCAANLDTVRHGLVKATFGNASAIDRKAGRIVIKPSGVSYDTMTPDQMVVTDPDGVPQDNRWRPSSDLETHVVLYRAFPAVGSIIHTHSTYATIFAQARRPIPPLGTTHADYFYGEVPVTRDLTTSEIRDRYVPATGDVIVETFAGRDPLEVPAVLVAGHGPFIWGTDTEHAVHNAMILEEIARMAWHTLMLNPSVAAIPQALLDRHYQRKHGARATYGQ